MDNVTKDNKNSKKTEFKFKIQKSSILLSKNQTSTSFLKMSPLYLSFTSIALLTRVPIGQPLSLLPRPTNPHSRILARTRKNYKTIQIQ